MRNDSPQVPEKPIEWTSSSREDLKEFPRDVWREVGFALDLAQRGEMSGNAKPLKGFHGASVVEIVSDYHSDTYRAVYTVQFREAIYVLHCFQKKSKRGIATPREEIARIQNRLKQAIEHYAEHYGKDEERKP